MPDGVRSYCDRDLGEVMNNPVRAGEIHKSLEKLKNLRIEELNLVNPSIPATFPFFLPTARTTLIKAKEYK